MNKNIKFEYKGTLNSEKKILTWLAIISIVSLVSTLIIEFVFNRNASDGDNHIAYWENVLLAVSGSAIISYICMIFPFCRKIDNEKNKLYHYFECIYVEYSKLINFIRNNAEQEYFSYDYFILEKNIEIINKINQLIERLNQEYKLSEIASEDFEKVINILNKDINCSLYVMDQFFSTIVLFEIEDMKSDDNDEKDAIEKNENTSKKVLRETYIRARKDYYMYIFGEIEKIYSYNDFINLFKNMFELFIVTNKLVIDEILNVQKLFEQNMLDNLKIAKGIVASNEIQQIHSKYLNEYLSEKFDTSNVILELFYNNFNMEDECNIRKYQTLKYEALEMVKKNETAKVKDLIEKFKQDHNIK